MRPLALAAALTLGAAVLSPTPGVSQQPQDPLVVTVIVIEEGADSEPIPGALVQIAGTDRRAVTDQAGRAEITVPTRGLHRVTASRLGYSSTSRNIVVEESRPASLRIALAVDPLRLAEVRVAAERTPPRKLDDFFQRESRSLGHFITPDDIARRRPHQFSDLLRDVPGLRVNCRFGGCDVASARASMAGRRCPMQFYIDGMRVFNMSPSEIPAPDVLAVEVYRGASEIPAEFNRGTAMCGVIVVWTQEPGRRHGNGR